MNEIKGHMSNKNVIVTGGSRGIGRSIVKQLAGHGANVLFTYNNNETAAKETEALASGSKGIKADMTNLSDINRLFEEANTYFSNKIDVVILNAFPTAVFKPTIAMSEAEYDSMFNGSKGNYFALQNAAKLIADGGRIVVLSSGAARQAGMAGGAYGAAKAAVERFTLALSKELGSRNVSVNVVAPGVTETEGLIAPQQMIDMLKSQIPFGRLGQPDEVASAIVMLTLPETGCINGQIIGANGGLM
ncbi:MAG: SDR family oxidoreductase [Runella slithyformis]|nr:MAG: SDR family oxidoreductase [Runella slithyformis]